MYKHSFSYLILILFCACQSKIKQNITLPLIKPVLVLRAQGNVNDTLLISVSKTYNVDEKIPKDQNLAGVTVLLYQEDKLVDSYYSINNNTDYYYSYNYYKSAKKYNIIENKKYTIKAFKEGFDTIFSTVIVPSNKFKVTYKIKEQTTLIDNKQYKEVQLIITDDGLINNGYQFSFNVRVDSTISGNNFYAGNNFYREACFISYDLELFNEKENIILQDNSINTCKYNYYLSDKNINGKEKNIPFYILTENLYSIQALNFRKYPYIKINILTNDEIMYIIQRKNGDDLSINNIFSEPINEYTNVKNGLGLFVIRNRKIVELK